MRKYLQIYKATIIENLHYIANIIIGFFSFLIMIFVLFNLWEYMYQDTSSYINGYSMHQMFWYVLITEGIWFGTRNKAFIYEIGDTIKSGNIEYNINKPYNYVIYLVFKNLGDITIKALMFMGIVLLVGNIFIAPLEITLISIPFILIVLFLGIIINMLIRIGISLISFWIEDSHPFHWVYDKMILILGTLLPIEMFPIYLRPIIKCLPTYVVMYGPAKLIVDFSFMSFKTIIIAQIIYLFVVSVIVAIMYNKGVKKLNVNGG